MTDGEVLALGGALACGAALGSACCVAVLHLTSQRSIYLKAHWQFPIVELFGWMIVVAIGSIVYRHSEFDDATFFVVVGVIGAAGGLALPIFLPTRRANGLVNMCATVLTLSAALISAILLLEGGEFDESEFVTVPLALGYGVVALWVIVQRLDIQRLTSIEIRPGFS